LLPPYLSHPNTGNWQIARRFFCLFLLEQTKTVFFFGRNKFLVVALALPYVLKNDLRKRTGLVQMEAGG
jgi:hypothetical protein